MPRRNVIGLPSYSCFEKVTATLRMIAYVTPTNMTNGYLRMAKYTILKCVKVFVNVVIRVYGARYLRAPNIEDTARILTFSEVRSWPGMLGSVDCMHWSLGGGRIALRHDTISSPGVAMIHLLFLKQLPTRIYGF